MSSRIALAARVRVSSGKGTTDILSDEGKSGTRTFSEFSMDADLILTDDSGKSLLVDTKYKILDATKRAKGPAREDFYQMYA